MILKLHVTWTKTCIRISLASKFIQNFVYKHDLWQNEPLCFPTGKLGNYLQPSSFPVSSAYRDSACVTLYVLQIHHSDSKLWRVSAMPPSLPLTNHVTTPSIKDRNLPGGGGRVFVLNKTTQEEQKNQPKAQLAHTYICSMTSFRNTPSTSATYSSRLVPFPPANGPNVLT